MDLGGAAADREATMIHLRDKANGAIVGSIGEEQLKFLEDLLEEDRPEDTDYYINEDTLDYMKDQGADAGLLDILRRALGGREEMEIEWSRD
jgi:processive 1,2-diacylglycerol beta-glucosyltransferase